MGSEDFKVIPSSAMEYPLRHVVHLLIARVVLLNHGCDFGNPSRSRVARKDQVQGRHEVALPATEAAMQISCRARVSKYGTLDEVQGIIERQDELGCWHIGSNGRLRRRLGPLYASSCARSCASLQAAWRT